ncbi:MAG TPA: TetR/AcrR family transcriptional regulator C-terminal domain-containing protein, partial [Myxococcaceae bacterium]|nr:TetR/AcrR family transcriptional regulator C-terminal domain-containing protein [Myxococcaceae bacterium]
IGPRRAMREVALQPTGDLRADLERVAATVMHYAAEDIDLLKLAILERMRGGPWAEFLNTPPMRARTILTRLLESYAASGALGPNDPERMAQAFAGMIFAFFASPVLEGVPPPDPEDTARFITHVFLDGLASTARRTP